MEDTPAGPRHPVRIVHIGLGRFFRAHQAWYTQHATDAADWGIAAFTVRSPRAARELAARGFSYPLIVRGPDGDAEERIESVVATHDGADVEAFRRYLAGREVAVVTLTVTEGGYGLDADGDPDLADAAVQGDLIALRAGATTASTVLGRLILGLDARRRADAGSIAVVPCDNIPDNGAFVARGVTGFATQVDEGLSDWIRANVSFVSTSVDRITPQVAEDEVVTESFSDWVLAGEFPAGRPRWESAGARFVDDIEPWENRKLWLLNGAHCVLAFAGIPRGLETVSDAIADPDCRARVEDFWAEAVAGLPPGTEHEDYRTQLIARFANRRIVHSLSQIAAGATSKVQFRFAAVAERTLDAGRAPGASAEATASWIQWLQTAPSQSDPRADELAAAAASDDPVAALIAVVSPRLAASEAFVARVRDAAGPQPNPRAHSVNAAPPFSRRAS
ncbi:mannitol dehydrogenase family protein [Microbacterium sp. PRC9]|uniref:mannitol dehydrogenase family protein n=1 Tax=Microbacterium sp. PRC9 TaxID=2962591 RepID=UPI0028812325|nr:mannitol dehydrogenase family protein [Microbacterium sp. PRC9]MDT0143934.1 mannitol dehydrogenase family protein [Microbacterium sp. PRC9]